MTTPTAPTAVTAAPTLPDRADRSTFPTRMYNFFAYLVGTFTTGIMALGTNVYNNALIAYGYVADCAASVAAAATQAGNAATSATAAQLSADMAGATAWVSGTTYAIGDARYSLIDFQSYRRITSGDGTTDPKNDLTNWTLAVAPKVVPSVVVITSTNTWTCPPGVTRAKVYVTGGGASAGNGVSQNAQGGGGGCTVIKYLTVTPGTVYTATIGAGGAALGAVGNAVGNSGGTTTFSGSGITTVSAGGGAGGNSSSSNANGLGGTTASGGDITINGGCGTASTVNGSSPPSHGGSTFWAGLSPGAVAGRGWGAGGGGNWNNAGGPAGAAGVVVIEY